MNAQMDLLSWWSGADWIVRGVFVMLSLLSLISWTVMLYKAWQFAAVYRGERNFSGLERSNPGLPSTAVASGLRGERMTADARETLAQALLRESRLEFESGLTLLATIGNASPFIGLFGTVWGIMHALQGLSGAKALSMDLVAGPVAEALVATAAGLFAAIPAVVGYNLLLRRLRRLFAAVETNVARILARMDMED